MIFVCDAGLGFWLYTASLKINLIFSVYYISDALSLREGSKKTAALLFILKDTLIVGCVPKLLVQKDNHVII